MDVITTQEVPAAPARWADDAHLLGQASRGDAGLFEAIMRRHNRLLFRSARGILSDDAEAQDVVQETYLRAFSRAASFRGDCALGTWLARIAINLALDVQRQRRPTVRLDDTAQVDTDFAMEQLMAFHAPPVATPDAQVERNEMRALLQRAIDSLPPIYRSVFMLRAVQEMNVDETASCLQVSDDVVKTRYLRARSMLRDALGTQVEAHVPDVYAFAGARCDAVVAHVLAQLLRDGRLRTDGPPG